MDVVEIIDLHHKPLMNLIFEASTVFYDALNLCMCGGAKINNFVFVFDAVLDVLAEFVMHHVSFYACYFII